MLCKCPRLLHSQERPKKIFGFHLWLTLRLCAALTEGWVRTEKMLKASPLPPTHTHPWKTVRLMSWQLNYEQSSGTTYDRIQTSKSEFSNVIKQTNYNNNNNKKYRGGRRTRFPEVVHYNILNVQFSRKKKTYKDIGLHTEKKQSTETDPEEARRAD